MPVTTERWAGSWWVPGHDRRVGGELVVEPRCRLTLSGSLVPDIDHTDELVEFPVIHGDSSGKQLSLLNTSCSSVLGPFTGSEEWIGDAIIESHVATRDGEPSFSKLRTSLPFLHAWLQLPRIGITDLTDEPGVTVVAKPVLVHETEVSEGAVIRLFHSLDWSISGQVLTLSQPVNVVLTTETLKSWRRMLEHDIGPLEALVWLATARHVGVGDLWVWHQGDPDWPAEWVRLHAPLVRPKDSGRRIDLHPYEMLFSADELPGGFDHGIRHWYRLWQRYSGIVIPLLALDRAPFSYTDDRFSTAVSAAEGYHALRFGDRDLPKPDHRARVEALRAVWPALLHTSRSGSCR